jgi:hypothetical protein
MNGISISGRMNGVRMKDEGKSQDHVPNQTSRKWIDEPWIKEGERMNMEGNKGVYACHKSPLTC